MKVYVYLDESGNIHKNSRTNFFAVGGYYVFNNDRLKVTSKFKKINKKAKDKRNIDYSIELKSYNYTNEEKKEIINSIQDLETFVGCAKVFNKNNMIKKIDNCNIFYNYAVGILVQDCIIPKFEEKQINDIDFILSVDSRSTSVNDLKDLEKYLNTIYCTKNFRFHVTYYDSASNYGIQLADLIVNSFYNKYKDIEIVKDIIDVFKADKFIVSLFPSKKW